MSLPAVAVAGPAFEIPMSAERWIVVWLVELLFPLIGSDVALMPIWAVLARSPLSAKLAATWTVTFQPVDAPFDRPALVQVTVPALLAQPASADTNVVPAGRASIRVKPALWLGPLFFTEIVYVMSVPAVAVDGPVFVTCRSAEVCTVV